VFVITEKGGKEEQQDFHGMGPSTKVSDKGVSLGEGRATKMPVRMGGKKSAAQTLPRRQRMIITLGPLLEDALK